MRSGGGKNRVAMSPGNAILPNGVMQTAHREIGVPGFLAIGFVTTVRCYLLAAVRQSRAHASPIEVSDPAYSEESRRSICRSTQDSFGYSLRAQSKTGEKPPLLFLPE